MARISKQRTIELLQSPSFFESLRLQFGSYTAAAKKTGIDRRRIAELADQRRTWRRGEVSDKLLDKIQKGLGKLKPKELETGKRYIYARDTMTPAQLRYAMKYSEKSEAGRKYFQKAVNDYYEQKTRRVLMPALNADGTFKVRIRSPKSKKATSRSGGRKHNVRRNRRRGHRR